MNDVYKTVQQQSQSVYRDKGSRFIGHLIPVQTADDVKNALERLRKEYHDARHHCYAFRLGPEGEAWRVNDDGEPSGSAGKPIYGQLLSYEISDVLAVVVRYFGGTKLGIPGLISAYRTAAREAILANQLIDKVMTKTLNLTFPYEKVGEVMKWIRDAKTEVVSSHFGMECNIAIKVRRAESERVIERLDTLRDIHWYEISSAGSF